jgi:hypothetical protein
VTGAHGIAVGYAALASAYLVVGIGLFWVLRRLARSPLHVSGVDEAGAELEAA